MARSMARSTARRDLAWIAAGFLALQLGLALAIDQFWPQFRDPAYHHKLTRLRSLLANSDVPPRSIVFLGSSRTGFGLQAGRLSQHLNGSLGERAVFFNFGMPGAGPVVEFLSLRRLLADGVRPAAVWIEIVPMFLAGQATAPSELDRFPSPRFRRDELDLLTRYGGASQRQRDWWLAWPAAWHAHRFEILSELMPSWVPLALRQNWTAGNDSWGWGTIVELQRTSESQRRAIESERAAYFGYFLDFQFSEPACAAMRDALTLCRDERVPAVLYFMPESAEFRSWYPPGMLAAIDQFAADLSAQFAVPIVDARGWIADDQFSDGHHLLPSGAAAFTDRLASDPVFRAAAGFGAPSTFTAQRP